MQTLVLQRPGRLQLADTPEPLKPGPGEALVRVRRVGVCGTDLHAYKGDQPFFQYPRILGHELAAEIVQVGPNERELKAGDWCAVEPYLNCRTCTACRRGKTNCCRSLNVLGVHVDGGMREFITIPVHKLHKSDVLSLEQLALVEMLCIGAHAVRRAEVTPGEAVLVIGAGPIGLSVAEFARLAGATVAILERNEHRLHFCRDVLGFEHTVQASGDALQNIERVFGGELPTATFDATGSPHSMLKAFDYVSHGGKLIYVGLFQGDVTFHDPDFHRREMSLLSSRNATASDFTSVITTLERGAIDVSRWISDVVSLNDAIAEFPRWINPGSGTIKAVLDLNLQ